MFIKYFFYFIIYSFLGYLCEVIYVSTRAKKITNRGYLYGPVCPIYGYGSLIILICLTPIYNMGMWYLVFILGIVLTSTLEYLTSYIMELIFHMRWWDYSDYKFNINGRVCLKNSIMFGILVMIVFYVTQPGVNFILDRIPSKALEYALFWTMLILYVVDTIWSTIKHINMAKVFVKIEVFMDTLGDKLENRSAQAKEYFSNTKLVQRLQKLNRHYPSLKYKMRKEKKRMSLKELIARIGNNDKE